MRKQQLKKIIEKIETHKQNISIERDKLREIYEELATCLESFDTGIDGLDEGILNILNAIDSISEVV